MFYFYFIQMFNVRIIISGGLRDDIVSRIGK